MKIGIFTHYFEPEIGAPALRIYETSCEWVSRGHAVDVVTGFPNHPFGRLYPGYDPALYRMEEMNGIRVHRCRTYLTPNRGTLRRTLGHSSFLPGALLAGRHLKGADLLLATSPPFFAATAAATIARIHRIPFVLEIRDLWPGIFSQLGVVKSRTLLKVLERWEMALYRSADQIVTVTESFQSHISDRGIPAWKIETIPNGANVAFWKRNSQGCELRKSLHLEGRFVVLYVGTMGLAQGLMQLLDAARLLEDRPEVTFLLVGEGAEKEQLRQRISQENQRNVVLLDAVGRPMVRELYSMADVCTVVLDKAPLLSEFIPSKIFEMMAMERPVVASVSGESAQIIEEAGAGIVVAPGEPDETASAIHSLIDQPGMREQMGKAGRAFVESHYSRSSLAQRYLQLLHGVTVR